MKIMYTCGKMDDGMIHIYNGYYKHYSCNLYTCDLPNYQVNLEYPVSVYFSKTGQRESFRGLNIITC